MRPHVGASVVLIGPVHNGTDEHPGIVTRVWDLSNSSESLVNVSVFPDGGGECQHWAQVTVYKSREAALQGSGRRAYWAG